MKNKLKVMELILRLIFQKIILSKLKPINFTQFRSFNDFMGITMVVKNLLTTPLISMFVIFWCLLNDTKIAKIKQQRVFYNNLYIELCNWIKFKKTFSFNQKVALIFDYLSQNCFNFFSKNFIMRNFQGGYRYWDKFFWNRNL